MKKHNRKFEYSISKQLPSIFIVLVAFTIFAAWLANSMWLEDYYVREKVKTLKVAYNRVNNAITSGDADNETFAAELDKLCDRYSIDILVIDSDSHALLYTGKDYEDMRLRIWDYLFLNETSEFEEEDEKEPEYGGEYEINVMADSRSGTEYVELWGTLLDGNMVLVRSPLESIQDSVKISNRFFTYICLFALAFSTMIICIVTRQITKPILELADISKKMAKLDFGAKYTGKSHNEIAILGDNINKLSDSLENTISELKTANAELQKDIKQKTEIDMMRREFLSDVSHELKTPIALIQSYAEGLEEGISDNPQDRKYYLDVIKDEACKMNTLVQQLLTLDHLESGEDNVQIQRFELMMLVRGCVDAISVPAKRNSIEVTCSDLQDVYVWGDEFKTEQVITNYLSNALNHCTGEKRIDIKVAENMGKVRVTVFNTGDCIPEEARAHVWEKFYKVDKARTRAYGGNGIGLSIVKAIMESMNQEYGVDNYENGVAFWFELDSAV